MSAPDFLDTNIFVYAYDPSDSRKQLIAQDLVRRAVNGELVTSAQVMGEYAATLLHKLSPKAKADDVLDLLDALGAVKLIETDADLVRRAVEAHRKYGIHFFDGMTVAAAERGRCVHICSEDLNAGQSYFGITVENPFKRS